MDEIHIHNFCKDRDIKKLGQLTWVRECECGESKVFDCWAHTTYLNKQETIKFLTTEWLGKEHE